MEIQSTKTTAAWFALIVALLAANCVPQQQPAPGDNTAAPTARSSAPAPAPPTPLPLSGGAGGVIGASSEQIAPTAAAPQPTPPIVADNSSGANGGGG